MENPGEQIPSITDNSSGVQNDSGKDPVITINKRQLIYIAAVILILILVLFVIYLSTRPAMIQPTASPLVTGTSPLITATVITTPAITSSTQEPTGTNEQTTVLVYLFDKNKFDLPGNTDYVTQVTRMTARKDVGTFAIEEIIKGPTAAEVNSGLAATFGPGNLVWFTGNSNCAGKDFTLDISAKKATVKFCKTTSMSGDYSGYITEQQIVNTLKQFSSVTQVRILNVSGACFNNMKGVSADECWEY